MKPPEWQLMNRAAQKSDKYIITIHTTSDVKRSIKVPEEAPREQRRRLEGEGRRIPTLDDDDDARILLHPQIANHRHYPNCPENPEPQRLQARGRIPLPRDLTGDPGKPPAPTAEATGEGLVSFSLFLMR